MLYFLMMWDLSNIIGLLGILSPIAVSIIGYLIARIPRFYFVQKSNIKLNEEIVKNIQGLTINYEGEPIKNNLNLISGTIIFRSDKDINSSDVDIPIYIEALDKSAVWKSFNIIASSPDFKPSYNIVDNRVTIDKTKIFKNDYFSFKGLVDTNNNVFKIRHRILNVSPETTRILETDEAVYKKAIKLLTLFFLFFTLINYFVLFEKDNVLTSMFQSENGPRQHLSTYDFEQNYSIRNKKINWEKFRSDGIALENRENLNLEKKAEKTVDSLFNIASKNPSFENKYNLKDAQLKQVFVAVTIPSVKYISIEKKADSLLENMLEKGNLQENQDYKVNDTISVNFMTRPIEKGSFIINLIPLIFLGTMWLIMLVLLQFFTRKYFTAKNILQHINN